MILDTNYLDTNTEYRRNCNEMGKRKGTNNGPQNTTRKGWVPGTPLRLVGERDVPEW